MYHAPNRIEGRRRKAKYKLHENTRKYLRRNWLKVYIYAKKQLPDRPPKRHSYTTSNAYLPIVQLRYEPTFDSGILIKPLKHFKYESNCSNFFGNDDGEVTFMARDAMVILQDLIFFFLYLCKRVLGNDTRMLWEIQLCFCFKPHETYISKPCSKMGWWRYQSRQCKVILFL